MADTVLESMVVRLIGDTANFQKSMKDAEKVTRDSTKVIETESKKAEDAQRNMMVKGQSVIEQYRTKQETLAAKLKELNKLHEKGAIDQATYSRATADAKKQAGSLLTTIGVAAGTIGSALALVAKFAEGAGASIYGTTNKIRDMATATERVTNRINTGSALTIETLSQDKAEAAKQLQQSIAAGNADLKKLERTRELARQRAEGGGGRALRASGSIPILGELTGAVDQSERRKAALSETTRQADAQRIAIQNLQNQLDRINGPAYYKLLVKNLNDATRAMDLQIATVGMTAAQIERYQLSIITGTDWITKMMIAVRLANSVEQEKELNVRNATQSVVDMNKELALQIATFHLNAEQARIYREEIQGADKAQVALARSLEMMKRGQEITKEFRTPMEVLAARQKELNDLYKAGAINTETYGKAIATAAKAAEGLNVQLGQAAKFGTAESLGRITDYLNSIKRPDVTLGFIPKKVMDAIPSVNPNDSQKVVDLLRRIAEATDKFNGRPIINIAQANLNPF